MRVLEPCQFGLFSDKVFAKSDPELLRRLKAQAANCCRCGLRSGAVQVVFGDGRFEHPNLLLVGEAPGEAEDHNGRPFVGKAGKLLDKMLSAIGFTRDDVYVCNVVNCRPPGNRTPLLSEIDACNCWLAGQIQAVKPKVIVALGGTAGNALLKNKKPEPVGALRGKWWEYLDVSLRVTYHPAALLRNPELKTDSWSDLQEVVQRLKSIT